MKSTVICVTDDMYSVELVKSNPTFLYVFGDNAQRYGKGGQACIRGLKNTFGVATKFSPGMMKEDFFSDANKKHLPIIYDDLFKLHQILIDNKYDKIVFPRNGLGTGLSDLPNKAPLMWRYLVHVLQTSFDLKTIDNQLYVRSEYS